MEWLHEKVYEHTGGSNYPFHMPGNKASDFGLKEIYRYDITEIVGFDDLRDAKGVIKDLEDGWARLYGAKKAYLLVNGSTCGNLSMIFAATSQNGTILTVGDCHWSVKNAAEIRGLKVREVYPDRYGEDFCKPTDPHIIEEELKKHTDIEAVIVTSPTYEGVVSDIRAISETVHRYGAKLLVDSAHGAHIGFRNISPEKFDDKRSRHWLYNPITQGADAVVVSLHKTLPVMGQVSLLMLPEGENLIEAASIKHFINIFQTSSPSYVLMSSASCALKNIMETGRDSLLKLRDELLGFVEDNKALKNMTLLNNDEIELSKIIISTKNGGMSGFELDATLRGNYNIYTEKACKDYIIGMTGMNDTEDGFNRLTKALHDIDKKKGHIA